MGFTSSSSSSMVTITTTSEFRMDSSTTTTTCPAHPFFASFSADDFFKGKNKRSTNDDNDDDDDTLLQVTKQVIDETLDVVERLARESLLRQQNRHEAVLQQMRRDLIVEDAEIVPQDGDVIKMSRSGTKAVAEQDETCTDESIPSLPRAASTKGSESLVPDEKSSDNFQVPTISFAFPDLTPVLDKMGANLLATVAGVGEALGKQRQKKQDASPKLAVESVCSAATLSTGTAELLYLESAVPLESSKDREFYYRAFRRNYSRKDGNNQPPKNNNDNDDDEPKSKKKQRQNKLTMNRNRKDARSTLETSFPLADERKITNESKPRPTLETSFPVPGIPPIFSSPEQFWKSIPEATIGFAKTAAVSASEKIYQSIPASLYDDATRAIKQIEELEANVFSTSSKTSKKDSTTSPKASLSKPTPAITTDPKTKDQKLFFAKLRNDVKKSIVPGYEAKDPTVIEKEIEEQLKANAAENMMKTVQEFADSRVSVLQSVFGGVLPPQTTDVGKEIDNKNDSIIVERSSTREIPYEAPSIVTRTDDFTSSKAISFDQRLESAKSFAIAAIVGGFNVFPFVWITDLFLDGDLNLGLHVEYDTYAAALQAGFFAIIYRYAVREDTDNPRLTAAIVTAFVWARTISQVEPSSKCTGLPLNCGAPLCVLDWNMITQIGLYGLESYALFRAAAISMDYFLQKGWIRRFKNKDLDME